MVRVRSDHARPAGRAPVGVGSHRPRHPLQSSLTGSPLMLTIELDYLGVLGNLVELAGSGHVRRGRTSTPWVSLSAPIFIDFYVGAGCRLPLLTTKKMHPKSILAELV
ncbi:MAG: hypothetical protein ACK559_04905, partial [bacterium]